MMPIAWKRLLTAIRVDNDKPAAVYLCQSCRCGVYQWDYVCLFVADVQSKNRRYPRAMAFGWVSATQIIIADLASNRRLAAWLLLILTSITPMDFTSSDIDIRSTGLDGNAYTSAVDIPGIPDPSTTS